MSWKKAEQNPNYSTTPDDGEEELQPFKDKLAAWWQAAWIDPLAGQVAFDMLLLLFGIGIGYLLRPTQQYEQQLTQLFYRSAADAGAYDPEHA